jgi:phage gpG-like protein
MPSAKLHFSVRIEGGDAYIGTLSGVADVIDDWSPALERIATNIVYPSIVANFAAEGRPVAWEGLTKEYAKKKFRIWGPKPILQASGSLFRAATSPGDGDNVTEITPTKLKIGIRGSLGDRRSGVFYGILHNRPGGVYRKRRRFIMLQDSDDDAILEALQDYLNEILG